jgi:hypothetical protein
VSRRPLVQLRDDDTRCILGGGQGQGRVQPAREGTAVRRHTDRPEERRLDRLRRLPGNGAKLIDVEDQQYDAALNDVALGPSIGSDVKLGPGSTRKGYLVFSVPKKIKLAKFQFTLDSGFAPQSAEWLLK